VYYPKAVKQLDALRGRFDKLDSQSTLRIVVVGGGLTGIEFAAAMRAYADRLPRPNATESIAVDLIEKEPRIAVDCLPSVSVTLHRQLEQTGIRVHTNTAVEKATREGVLCKDGTTRRADVVVSTIGCAPNLRFEHPDLSVAANGIETDQHLCCSQYNYIYAIGDVAKPPSHFEVRKRASSAIRMGRLAAHNICNDLRSRPLTSLQQRRQAVSVLTGERNALIAYGRHHFSGLSGYAVKLFLENHYA
jgi:NADH dehydrogenase